MQRYRALIFASLLAIGTAAMATQASAESNISGGENLGPPMTDFWPAPLPATTAHASAIRHPMTVHKHRVVHKSTDMKNNGKNG